MTPLDLPYIRKPICKVRSCLIDGEMMYCMSRE